MWVICWSLNNISVAAKFHLVHFVTSIVIGVQKIVLDFNSHFVSEESITSFPSVFKKPNHVGSHSFFLLMTQMSRLAYMHLD